MSPEFPASPFGWVLLGLGALLATAAAGALASRGPWARRVLRHAWLHAALTALLVSAGLSLIAPPVPRAFDEFSYLLAGDTFAHGRLTNPALPHPDHFEAAHVLVQPSYQSKYPPAQGLFIALGSLLTGLPIAGIWLSFAAACAVLPWALRPWAGPRWAAIGALAAAVHPGFHLGYLLSWSQSWSGGAVAFLAGALVLGAAGRLARRPLARDAAVFGAGAGLLALCRPWEGLLACLIAGGFVAWRLARRRVLPRPVLAIALLGAAAPFLAFLAVYNAAVTGSAFTMPYALHEARYGSNPLFLWQDPLPAPRLKCPDLTRQLIAVTQVYDRQRTFSGFVSEKCSQYLTLAEFSFVSIFLIIPLVLVGIRRRRFRRGFALAVFGVAAIAGNVWIQPHYAAPFAALLLLPFVEVFRVGRWRVPVVSMVFVLAALLLARRAVVLREFDAEKRPYAERARMAAELTATGAKHLVLVRYRCETRVDFDWVYNESDLTAAPVVWAREIDAAGADGVMVSFPGRVVWVLEVRDKGLAIQLLDR